MNKAGRPSLDKVILSMLTARITVPSPEKPEIEDIFSSSLNALFTDNTQYAHGTPGGTVIYYSPTYGPLTLQVPAHPDTDEGRRLFAHYVWNSGVIAASLIETASGTPPVSSQDDSPFNVSGKSTLELGAGTALPSLISALSGASRVVITDHPNSPSITADTITSNVQSNLFPRATTPRTDAQVSVRGYVWGEATLWSPSRYGQPQPQPLRSTSTGTPKPGFDRLLICDCLWMPSQHRNLVTSILKWLYPSSFSVAIVIAGFHTGRSIVSNFFSIATGEDTNGRGTNGPLSISEIYEIDVDGVRREWQSERVDETKDQAKRWCVVGLLMWR
jgi:nicotinamide N-methyltransferase